MWENINQDRHYIGEFLIDGEYIRGEILYNKGNGIILLNLKRRVDCIGKSYGDIDYIIGKLNTGDIITLCKNKCVKNHTQGFHYQQLQFSSQYMLWGQTEMIERKFNKLTCIIENGVRWSGLSQINLVDLSTVQINNIDTISSFQWYDAKISFSTVLESDLWSFPRNEFSKIVERLSIVIESDEKQGVEFFLQVRNNILSMLSFAIKDNVNIEKQHLSDYDDVYTITNGTTQQHKYLMISNEPYYHIYEDHFQNYNFSLAQLSNDFDISEKLRKLVPIFNLYLSLFKYEDMPPEMVFLNIVQAIETFHSRFYYKNQKKEFIKSVSDRFSSCANYELIKKLLLNDTQMDKNCNFIILVSRLNDLLIGKNDGLFCEFYEDDPEYAQRIADTRHYYTHYGESKEQKALKDDDLLNSIGILKLLLEYNVCLVLGIDNSDYVVRSLRNFFNH